MIFERVPLLFGDQSAQTRLGDPEMRKRIKKILNVIGSVLVAAVLLLAAVSVGVRVVGIRTYAVVSGSMEPTYPTGSLLYVKSVDAEDLKVGDAITFYADEDTVATHRITEIIPDEEDGGVLRFRTRGDANDTEDGAPVHSKNIIGEPLFAVPYLGYFAHFVQKPPGLYLAIGLVCISAVLAFLPDFSGDKKRRGERSLKTTE